jgi:transposase
VTSAADEPLPSDLAAAHAMILVERAARIAAEAEVERLKLLLALARREQYGQSSERGRRLREQLELKLEELDARVGAANAAVEIATPTIEPHSVQRRMPARRPLPESQPRQRIVYPAPEACPCCRAEARTG